MTSARLSEPHREGRGPDRGRSTSAIACTVVARNYLPYARVLADSWRSHHPRIPFVALVVDADDHAAGARESFEVVTPFQLGVPEDEILVQQGMYGPTELSTALKPHLLTALLARGFSAAIYVDPDTRVYGSLEFLAARAEESGIALCPHVLHPFPDDGMSPSALEIHVGGIFNLGLIGVGEGAHEFLAWWSARLRRDCVLDPSRGLFVDQRWVDWVPSLFRHVVIRNPAINVAFWNLHERMLGMSGRTLTIDGQPLRHFHFSGFDPRRRDLLTTYELAYASPMRVTMASHVALRDVCHDYAAEVLGAGFAEALERPYGLERAADGSKLGRFERMTYRAAVLASEAEGRPLPPSPFDGDRAADFARLMALDDTTDLSAAVRAQLVRLRGDHGTDSRRPPSSRVGRLSHRLRSTAAGRLPRRRRVRNDAEESLRALLFDIDQKLGRQLVLPDDLDDYLAGVQEGRRT